MSIKIRIMLWSLPLEKLSLKRAINNHIIISTEFSKLKTTL